MNGDHIAPSGDESAGEKMPKIMQSIVADAGADFHFMPACADDTAPDRLTVASREHPFVEFVAAGVRVENVEELLATGDGAHAVIFRRPYFHHRCGGALHLTLNMYITALQVDVGDQF